MIVGRIVPVAAVVVGVVSGPAGIILMDLPLRLPGIHPVAKPDPFDPRRNRRHDLHMQGVMLA